jgi:hypothetical protein
MLTLYYHDHPAFDRADVLAIEELNLLNRLENESEVPTQNVPTLLRDYGYPHRAAVLQRNDWTAPIAVGVGRIVGCLFLALALAHLFVWGWQ